MSVRHGLLLCDGLLTVLTISRPVHLCTGAPIVPPVLVGREGLAASRSPSVAELSHALGHRALGSRLATLLRSSQPHEGKKRVLTETTACAGKNWCF